MCCVVKGRITQVSNGQTVQTNMSSFLSIISINRICRHTRGVILATNPSRQTHTLNGTVQCTTDQCSSGGCRWGMLRPCLMPQHSRARTSDRRGSSQAYPTTSRAHWAQLHPRSCSRQNAAPVWRQAMRVQWPLAISCLMPPHHSLHLWTRHGRGMRSLLRRRLARAVAVVGVVGVLEVATEPSRGGDVAGHWLALRRLRRSEAGCSSTLRFVTGSTG